MGADERDCLLARDRASSRASDQRETKSPSAQRWRLDFTRFMIPRQRSRWPAAGLQLENEDPRAGKDYVIRACACSSFFCLLYSRYTTHSGRLVAAGGKWQRAKKRYPLTSCDRLAGSGKKTSFPEVDRLDVYQSSEKLEELQCTNRAQAIDYDYCYDVVGCRSHSWLSVLRNLSDGDGSLWGCGWHYIVYLGYLWHQKSC